jgi:sigma-E factor negative regulatory protein RseA
MSERMRESLSALLDDEANELEIERVLSHISDDERLRQTWVRYNAVRASASGHQLAHMSLDISAQLRHAVAAETAPAVEKPGLKQRLLRPVASLAVAASVAAVVVVGGQQLAQIDGGNPYGNGQAVAAGSGSPVGMLNSLGATTVQASYGARPIPVLQPATRTAYQELARQRMQKYMQEHAEHAALNSPQGLIPFARVPQIRE